MIVTCGVCNGALVFIFLQAISPNTILLAASAIDYCYGMVDPIAEISDIAVEKGLPFHVDACMGGFMLPW